MRASPLVNMARWMVTFLQALLAVQAHTFQRVTIPDLEEVTPEQISNLIRLEGLLRGEEIRTAWTGITLTRGASARPTPMSSPQPSRATPFASCRGPLPRRRSLWCPSATTRDEYLTRAADSSGQEHLNVEVAESGIYVGTLSIAAFIGGSEAAEAAGASEWTVAFPVVGPDDLAALYGDMYTKRDRIEEVHPDLRTATACLPEGHSHRDSNRHVRGEAARDHTE
ncbi:hypothetical protein [Nonomuraea sp. NPDC049141]|uniref:hypothetical protein n=1 Tax=Nonomuraea sp. NPDC049141 TaxID=3155500 RepID=UPI003403D20C